VQTLYHPGGNIECTQMWAEGMLDGLMWSYRVDGTLEQSQMFVKGQLHGPSITYHTDGATVVRSLQFMHGLQVCAAASAAADASSLTPPSSLFQDGTCQWFRNDGSRLSAAEYSYGKLHGAQTWYKADGYSVDYVEKYWNGARMRADIDHMSTGSGSPGSSCGTPGRWTEVEREQVKVT
jgi:antitoxin component YwqK of YwqJK toxin-antitoxin module